MPKFCPSCGTQLQYQNAMICPNCGAKTTLTPEVWKEIRNPFVAVVLSFLFVGWGQWYNGKTWDGLKFFGAFLVSYLLLCFFIRMMTILPKAVIFELFFFVIIIGLWIYGMYDAYKTADRINRKKESFFRKSRLFWLPVVLLILLIFVVIAAFIFGMAGNIQTPTQTSTIARANDPIIGVWRVLGSNYDNRYRFNADGTWVESFYNSDEKRNDIYHGGWSAQGNNSYLLRFTTVEQIEHYETWIYDPARNAIYEPEYPQILLTPYQGDVAAF